MSRLPVPPREVWPCQDLAPLAPKFRAALERVIARMVARGYDAIVYETLRTPERQEFLYGFGRDYDDFRGIVTNCKSAFDSWHGFGLAADIVSRADLWDAPAAFWAALEHDAMAEGLTSGADWNRNGVHDEKFCDRPHVQWWCEGMHVSPSDHARELAASQGVESVWREVHAI